MNNGEAVIQTERSNFMSTAIIITSEGEIKAEGIYLYRALPAQAGK